MPDLDSKIEAQKAQNAASAEEIERLKEQLAIAQHNEKQGVSTTTRWGNSLDPQLSTTFTSLFTGGKRSRKRKRNTKRRKSRRRR